MAAKSDSLFMHFDDGTSGWVPRSRVSEAMKDGGKIGMVRLRSPYGQERMVHGASAGRLIDAGATEVAPGEEQKDVGLGGAIGGVARQTLAGAPAMLAQVAPMAIPGSGLLRAGARLGTAFAAGAGADMASRGVRGDEQDPRSSALMGLLNAGWQAPFEGAAALAGKMPHGLAKSALGNARPDMPSELLEAKTPVSQEGMAADQKFIDRKTGLAQRAIQGPLGQSRTFSSKPLEDVVNAFVQRAKKYDLISGGGEKSAQEAFNTMLQKLEALHIKKQVAGSMRSPGWKGAAATPAAKTVSTGQIAATDIDGINQYAESAAKKLFEARKANKIDDPGQDELMYKAIADATNKMLNTIPMVERSNLSASRRIDLKRAKAQSLSRSEGKPASPMAAIMHLGQTPESLSRMGFKMNNPVLPDAIRTVPRQLGVSLAGLLGQQQ